jgi:SWIM zinc finger
MPTLISAIVWDSDTSSLNFTGDIQLDTPDVLSRRWRAKEVVETYAHKITPKGVSFNSFIHTVLTSGGVSCTCPDYEQRGVMRGIPCKHIFAAAHILGDHRIIPESAPAKQSTLPINTGAVIAPEDRKWRSVDQPQAVRVGKHFMLSDFLYSETAVTKGITNCPPLDGKEVQGIKGLCIAILDPVVERFGAVSITYGYSSPELHAQISAYRPLGVHNGVAAAGGTIAAAADILVHSMVADPRAVLHWVQSNCVFDRLILYPNSPRVCVAWSDKPRYHAKEWYFTDSFSNAIYAELRRAEAIQATLNL